MAGQPDFTTGVGATGPRLVVTLGGGDLDLEGAVVKLRYRRSDALSVVEKPGLLLSTALRQVGYDPDAADTARPAILRFRFKVTLTSGQIVFWPDGDFGTWEVSDV